MVVEEKLVIDERFLCEFVVMVGFVDCVVFVVVVYV